jgi:superfamily II DNA or RNA helicase
MKAILCNRGYVIQKDKFSDDIIESIKKDLKVKPYVVGKRSLRAESFNIYIENESKLCLPKFYALEKLGRPDKLAENIGLDIDITFEGSLRDYQIKIIDIILPKIKDIGGGILSIPPGKGKTVLF